MSQSQPVILSGGIEKIVQTQNKKIAEIQNYLQELTIQQKNHFHLFDALSEKMFEMGHIQNQNMAEISKIYRTSNSCHPKGYKSY